MISYKDYLLKVYSSWLGKVIGVRLGAPVENWTRDKIVEVYGDNDDYLVDYGVFAADDDTNGPLFFPRALLDEGHIDCQTVGRAYLNYLQEYMGFFWWGGVGVSTEHTAYENLKQGVVPPLSGSAKTNGLTIAEQIGGQIFSDCWGYLSLGDPIMAAQLARQASSVSHDGSGIQGGIFVAVCIALAYDLDDIHEVIDKALSYLDKDLEYYRVVKDIVDHYKDGLSFDDCYKYILDNYDYDKYDGVCHIIPNAALMILAMCYGDNDFSKTLVMLNRLGRDTDCNVGNVGSIMGALVGLEGIDVKWILPINDIVNASSCIGCLNIQTVSDSAAMFAKMAYKLNGIEIEDDEQFILPYATKGFFGDVCVKDGTLRANGEIFKFSYYLPEDIFDSRYDPSFSPLVYPGDQIEVISDDDIRIFVEDVGGKRFYGNKSLLVPEGDNRFIRKLGFVGDQYSIKKIIIKHSPILSIDFTSLVYDGYGPRYEGDTLYNIRGFVKHSGDWKLENGLKGSGGLISMGHLDSNYHEISAEFSVLKGNEFYLVFDMSGYLKNDRVGFKDDQLVYMRDKEIVWSVPYELNNVKTHKLFVSDNKIMVDDDEFAYRFDNFKGLFGFTIGTDNEALIKRIVVK